MFVLIVLIACTISYKEINNEKNRNIFKFITLSVFISAPLFWVQNCENLLWPKQIHLYTSILFFALSIVALDRNDLSWRRFALVSILMMLSVLSFGYGLAGVVTLCLLTYVQRLPWRHQIGYAAVALLCVATWGIPAPFFVTQRTLPSDRKPFPRDGPGRLLFFLLRAARRSTDAGRLSARPRHHRRNDLDSWRAWSRPDRLSFGLSPQGPSAGRRYRPGLDVVRPGQWPGHRLDASCALGSSKQRPRVIWLSPLLFWIGLIIVYRPQFKIFAERHAIAAGSCLLVLFLALAGAQYYSWPWMIAVSAQVKSLEIAYINGVTDEGTLAGVATPALDDRRV